jgi:ankyrin repeat protein
MAFLDEIAAGRTDRVFEFLAGGGSASAVTEDGVPLLAHCAYYGDVSAIKFLLASGASLRELGENLGLSAASFHGHWRLCRFLIEQGADVNRPDASTGETPLHLALCTAHRLAHNLVLKVLLAAGANPNSATRENIETGSFMRDCRTKGETPLHRAAAFGDEEAIQLLLNAGAKLDARDMHGDSPLSWASWYGRPTAILRQLCFGDFRVRAERKSMRAYVLGEPLD